MAKLVLIIGPSGSGKSRSMKTLNPKTNYVINADKKDLPFKGAGSLYSKEKNNYTSTSSIPVIRETLKRISEKGTMIQTVEIDTLNSIMNDKEMSERRDKNFDKWMDLAADVYELANFINESLRPNLTVYMTAHDELVTDAEGQPIMRRIKTNGRKLEKIILEGKATIVLFTKVSRDGDSVSYNFVTQSDGISTAKSPEEMFEELLIPNDLQYVTDRIQDYYGIKYPVANTVQKPVAVAK